MCIILYVFNTGTKKEMEKLEQDFLDGSYTPFECQSPVCVPPSPKADSPASPTPDSSSLASQATDLLLPPVVSLTTKSKHPSLHVKRKTEGEITFSIYLTLHKFLCGHEDTIFSRALCMYVCKYMIVVVFEVVFEYMYMLHIKCTWVMAGITVSSPIVFSLDEKEVNLGKSFRNEVKKRKTCSEHTITKSKRELPKEITMINGKTVYVQCTYVRMYHTYVLLVLL